jgi:D-alanyl-D-alanine carboxypeptidase
VSATAWIVHDSVRRKTYGTRHLVEKEIASLTKIMTCIIVLEMIEKHTIDQGRLRKM